MHVSKVILTSIFPSGKRQYLFMDVFGTDIKNANLQYQPKSNVAFWNLKFEKNIKRDKAVQEVLYGQKIKCLIVWECTIKQMKRDPIFSELIIEKTKEFICGREMYLEL